MNEVEEKRIRLYVDLDDTVLDSSEAVIEILNKKHGMNKTINDLKDWNFRSIYHNMTSEMVVSIFDSDEFFDTVKINGEFADFYKKHANDFKFVFVSKGYKANIDKKRALIEDKFPGSEFIPCLFYPDVDCDYDKSHIDMRGGIQIDDRFDCLCETNASCKILIDNGRDLKWSRQTKTIDGLYKARGWKDAGEILEYALLDGLFIQ